MKRRETGGLPTSICLGELGNRALIKQWKRKKKITVRGAQGTTGNKKNWY